jgi:hypothetical protein
MFMAFTLSPYARALLRADKDKLGKDSSPWPQYARGDENVRRGEAAGFARGGQLKSKPRGARSARPGATSQR